MTLTDLELDFALSPIDRKVDQATDRGLVLWSTASLKVGAFRTGGLDARHVESLVGSNGAWPPILVAVSQRVVIDGAHRVHAGLALGLEFLTCELFEGPEYSWYLEFVRRNASHGKPLALVDRHRAASELLRRHGDWSNRRIAQFCGMSPHAVAALRSREEPVELNSGELVGRRVGRDGRSRPVSREALRGRIAAEIEKSPHRSLREVAAVVGASPETVRSVRRSLEEDFLAQTSQEESRARSREVDQALATMERGEEFLDWFDRTAVGDRWEILATLVPLNRVYEIADEARSRANTWRAFADLLEQRASRGIGDPPADPLIGAPSEQGISPRVDPELTSGTPVLEPTYPIGGG